jgi:uncharacterized protein YbbC (DUF1343 family)
LSRLCSELAQYLDAEHGIGCDLTVVAMRGWRRRMHWEDTELPWVAPASNMPTPDTARVYPGGCLYEGTNLSEGRGATRPFEWVGAPYLDAHRYTDALAAARLPGVHFRPARFQPTFHKWAGRLCGGVQVHVTDRAYAPRSRDDAHRGFTTCATGSPCAHQQLPFGKLEVGPTSYCRRCRRGT